MILKYPILIRSSYLIWILLIDLDTEENFFSEPWTLHMVSDM